MKPWLLLLAALLAGCDDRAEQPLYRSGRGVPLWQGADAPAAVPGSVARGDGARLALLQRRPALDAALLQRGAERYAIYCSPCHGLAGLGDGLVVARGFPRPPAFAEARLRGMPDAQLLQVIAEGHGVMYGYAARIEPADRWAIVAHLRALQLSQHAPLATLPAALRRALENDHGH